MTWVINQQRGHIFAGFNRLDVDHTGKVSLHNFRTCLMDIFAEHPDASHTVLLAKFCQEAFNHVSGYSSLDSIWVVSADVSTFHTFPYWKGCLVVFTGESDGCLSMFQLDPMNDTQACLVPCLVSGGEWRYKTLGSACTEVWCKMPRWKNYSDEKGCGPSPFSLQHSFRSAVAAFIPCWFMMN